MPAAQGSEAERLGSTAVPSLPLGRWASALALGPEEAHQRAEAFRLLHYGMLCPCSGLRPAPRPLAPPPTRQPSDAGSRGPPPTDTPRDDQSGGPNAIIKEPTAKSQFFGPRLSPPPSFSSPTLTTFSTRAASRAAVIVLRIYWIPPVEGVPRPPHHSQDKTRKDVRPADPAEEER